MTQYMGDLYTKDTIIVQKFNEWKIMERKILEDLLFTRQK